MKRMIQKEEEFRVIRDICPINEIEWSIATLKIEMILEEKNDRGGIKAWNRESKIELLVAMMRWWSDFYQKAQKFMEIEEAVCTNQKAYSMENRND